VSWGQVSILKQHPKNAQHLGFIFLHSSGSNGITLINEMPCPMLSHNKCTVYAARPSGCASFPHLHEPGISRRLFFVMNHYGICPIVYHVVEALKQEVGWNGLGF
jgi:Fe-S-cluster containining protein